MDETTLARVIEILETDPDFYVPVKKLWLILQEESLAPNLDPESFYAQLEADKRFEFIQGVDRNEDFNDPDTLEMQQEMEALGFFSGPRVKLVTRQMSTEDVFAGLSRSLKQLNAALRGAWETRPSQDDETEALLLDAIAMAERLERDVHGMIEKET